ncbi:type II toxin-antitoxin system RelE/ParE family toxin [Thermomonas fusca]|uniref:Toxin n=1 Tax=Thermomonas fusca TaxID=215690 RepID=A0A5R9PCY1_9GAMM|nr:type II toxin-antitoxin system RelE/ParE family toxin [Thermomonas fusca]TLX21369.1 type II toxin-antitoxin system RelE/ParE family toxin [Thermomonas fusca]
MTAFDLTRAAQDDLKAIARQTQAQWGQLQRNRYLHEMDQLFGSLAGNPAMGRACDEVRAGYRKFPHGGHVIYYQQLAGYGILIVRILHASMDANTQLDA